MTVYYEWVVETVKEYEDGDNDIIETQGNESYADAVQLAERIRSGLQDDCHVDIVLVRDDDDRRSWASLYDGKLSEFAEDANGGNWGKIPKKYHAEVARYKA